MPEAIQYVLGHKELVKLIIKECGVHDGRWYLLASFGVTAGNYGPSNDQMSPGVVVAVTQVGIQRADSNMPPEMVVDAAIVNPLAK